MPLRDPKRVLFGVGALAAAAGIGVAVVTAARGTTPRRRRFGQLAPSAAARADVDHVFTSRWTQFVRGSTSVLRSRADAEDAVADAYRRAIEAVAAGAVPTNPDAWARSIVFNETRRVFADRAKARRTHVPIVTTTQPRAAEGARILEFDPPSRAPSPEHVAIVRHRAACARRAIRTVLTPAEREAIEGVAEGATPTEVAQAVGVAPGAIRVRLVTARRKIARACGGAT